MEKGETRSFYNEFFEIFGKDAAGNYLATSRAYPWARMGLRLAEVGRLISITVLRVDRRRQKMRAGASRAVFVVAILAPALAWAQDGAIVGRVLDAAGDPLPGATIAVVGPALAGPRVSATDLQGRYRVTELPLGMYTVTLSLPGFRSVVRDGIVVVTGLAPRVDAELDVGTDDDVRVDIRIYSPGPGGSDGAALECTFLPGGAIVDCRRVDVAGQQLPRFRGASR